MANGSISAMIILAQCLRRRRPWLLASCPDHMSHERSHRAQTIRAFDGRKINYEADCHSDSRACVAQHLEPCASTAQTRRRNALGIVRDIAPCLVRSGGGSGRDYSVL